ncbi:hypothetical protein [Clostridium botulinum]|uniref:hypothetical protein n=1 Tax=Clostridium botulinum TaxID=1491 RepID=UPI001967A8EA|nr:hypothetical protein [Clostridium botulinum]MBN1050434.1 hypothetical protein [Clostridium botulinum]
MIKEFKIMNMNFEELKQNSDIFFKFNKDYVSLNIIDGYLFEKLQIKFRLNQSNFSYTCLIELKNKIKLSTVIMHLDHVYGLEIIPLDKMEMIE